VQVLVGPADALVEKLSNDLVAALLRVGVDLPALAVGAVLLAVGGHPDVDRRA
jgi:hypothetical protein